MLLRSLSGKYTLERYEPPYPPSYWLNCKKQWRCPWCNGYRRRKWTQRHEIDCISNCTNTIGKDMSPIILPAAMGK